MKTKTKKKTSSLDNRVTSTRRLYYICARMGWRITGDALMMLGEPPLSTLPAGRALSNGHQTWDDRGWQRGWQLEQQWRAIPACDTAGGKGVTTIVLQTDDTAGLGRARLITYKAARQFIVNHARRFDGRFDLSLRADATYKGWVLFERMKLAIGRATGRALVELGDSLYGQNKARGKQAVRARHWKPKNTGASIEIGQHGGHTAYRRQRGRPALSAAEWLRRYHVRKLAGRVPRKYESKRPSVQPPETKFARPGARALQIAGRPDIVAPKRPSVENAPAQTIWAEVKKETVDAIRDALKDMSAEAAEAAMEWLYDVTGVRKK